MEEHMTASGVAHDTIHKILAHSYSMYLGSLLLGLLLDFLLPQDLTFGPSGNTIGILLLGFASAIIVWAQMTSRDLEAAELNKETFARGPYRISRTPTHWGLFLLMLGFGIISGGLFIIVLSFAAFVVTKFIFIRKEEEALSMKYGDPYIEYKRSVKL